jgi:hypothetical protein
MEILNKDAKKDTKRHRDLMKYFNENLFPDDSEKNTLADEEIRLLKAISDDEDDGQGDGNGLANGQLEEDHAGDNSVTV